MTLNLAKRMSLLMVMFFCSEFQIVHSSFAKNTNNTKDVTQQKYLQTSCLSNPKLCFQTIYKDLPAANHYLKDEEESEKQRKSVLATGGCPTYGEMTYTAIEKMLKIFKATSNDTFADLGSGSGKAPIQFTLMTGGKSYGIEFVKFRHELALKAHQKLPKHLKPLVKFEQGDMFKAEIPEATIYMIDAVCFSEKDADLTLIFLKYGPKKFRVWSIGHELPFPKKYVKKIEDLSCTATWCKGQPSVLMWIEK